MENAEKAKATIENGLSTYIESDDVLPNAKSDLLNLQRSRTNHLSVFFETQDDQLLIRRSVDEKRFASNLDKCPREVSRNGNEANVQSN